MKKGKGVSVVHLTSVHPRYDTRIFHKECRSLATAGYDVALVVADGRPDETRDGVRIVSVKPGAGRFERALRVTRRVCEHALRLDANIYHLHDPELLPVAGRLKSAGKAVVFDAHEDTVRQILLKEYLPRPVRGLLSRGFKYYEDSVVQQIDAVVTATDQQVARYTGTAVRICPVQNFAELGRFESRVSDMVALRILHAGSLTRVRGVTAMVRLASKLQQGDELRLAGPLEQGLSASHLSDCQYLGVIDQNSLRDAYAQANVGLILYEPVGQYGMATAVKLYEYMAAGLPILVPNHGEWPAKVQSIGCGIPVDVFDTADQLRALEWLRNNPHEAAAMGRRGQEYALKHASWNVAFSRLDGLYKEIINENW